MLPKHLPRVGVETPYGILFVSVPEPAQVELRHSTEPAESVSGPFTVKVRPEANKVALAEFSVKPAMVGLTSSVTV